MHLADNTFNVAQDMAFDPFGKTLYVTLQDPVALNTALTAVDIASRQTERKLNLNGLSKGVVMNYYGTHLYVAVDAILAQSSDIRVLNNPTNELVSIRWPISLSDGPPHWSRGRTYWEIFTAVPSGSLSSSIQTPWISERWRWMRLRKRRCPSPTTMWCRSRSRALPSRAPPISAAPASAGQVRPIYPYRKTAASIRHWALVNIALWKSLSCRILRARMAQDWSI